MHLSFHYNETGAGWILTASGLGPALLQTFEVFVNGEPQRHWGEVIAALGLSGTTQYEFLVPSPNYLYRPGSSDRIFWIPPGPNVETLRQRISQVFIHACYCSLYKECWNTSNITEVSREQVWQCRPYRNVMFAAPPMSPTIP